MSVPHPYLPLRGSARGRKRLPSIPFWGTAGFAVLLGMGLASSPAQGAEPSTGEGLYNFRCALCHYRDRADYKFGPSLKGLFQRQNLLNGKPVNAQNISGWISNGSPNMPGFRYSLDRKEMQSLMEYLRKL